MQLNREQQSFQKDLETKDDELESAKNDHNRKVSFYLLIFLSFSFLNSFSYKFSTSSLKCSPIIAYNYVTLVDRANKYLIDSYKDGPKRRYFFQMKALEEQLEEEVKRKEDITRVRYLTAFFLG